MLKDPNVLFAGYKNPHPMENKVVVRIQTTSDYAPNDALTHEQAKDGRNNSISNIPHPSCQY